MFKVEIIRPYWDNTEIGEYDTLEEAQAVAVEVDKELFAEAQTEQPVIEHDMDAEMYMDGAPYVVILETYMEDIDGTNLVESYDYVDFDHETDLRGYIESLIPDED